MSPSRNPLVHQCQVQRVERKEGLERQMRSLKDLHVFYPLQVRSTSSLPAKARRYSRTTENSTSWWTLKGALSFEYTEQHIVYNGVYATASLFFHFHCSHVKYVMLLLSNANIETRVINSISIPLYKTSPGILLTCCGLDSCVVSSYQEKRLFWRMLQLSVFMQWKSMGSKTTFVDSRCVDRRLTIYLYFVGELMMTEFIHLWVNYPIKALLIFAHWHA